MIKVAPWKAVPLVREIIMLAASLGLLAWTHVVSAETFDYTARVQAGQTAEFRLWVPEGLAKAEAVISLAPGYGGDGRGQVNDGEWQALAREHSAVIIGLHLKGDSPQYFGSRWAFDAFDRALQELSSQAGVAGLDQAPLLMWGHSAGGQFNYCYAADRPRRVAAFVVNKGVNYPCRDSASMMKIPAVFFIGGQDTADRHDAITRIWESGRQRGASWCLAVEPNEGHGVGRSKTFTVAFFDAVLSDELEVGWSGHLETREFENSRAMSALAERRHRTWLPNEALATHWSEVTSP